MKTEATGYRIIRKLCCQMTLLCLWSQVMDSQKQQNKNSCSIKCSLSTDHASDASLGASPRTLGEGQLRPHTFLGDLREQLNLRINSIL